MKRTSYPEKARARIKTGMAIRRLCDFVKAKPSDPDYKDKVMTAAQVQAARTLIAKTLPDLKQTEFKGSIDHKHTQEMTRDELLAIAARGRTGNTEAGQGSDKSSSVH